MSYTIKELSVGGVLDQALKVTKDGIGMFLPIVFCAAVPLQIAIGLVQVSMTPELPPDATPEEVFAAQTEAQQAALPLAAGGGLLLGLVVNPVTSAALIYAISTLYLGDGATLGASFSKAFSRLLPLLGTTILYSLAVMGGMLLLIIPGILAALCFWLYQYIVVLENKGGSSALSRSRELMKGNWSKVIAIGFLVFVMLIGVQAAAAFIPQPHVAVIAQGVLQGLTMIFSAAVGVVFYFSCLCQHENYDLKRLAEAVGAEDAPPEPEPSLGV